MTKRISDETVDELYKKLHEEADTSGYHLNPDVEFTRELVYGLIENTERYGYPSCPCRLSSGARDGDLDIICPCDYRDPDLNEYGACYCALYVSQDIVEGKKNAEPIPERRNTTKRNAMVSNLLPGPVTGTLTFPVWRCRVCGYLCARQEPPEVCPICKAKKERFEKFLE